MNEDENVYLEIILIVFLLAASLWSYIVDYIVKFKKNPKYQQPILLVVALATALIFVKVIVDRENNNIGDNKLISANINANLLLAASFFIFFHHFIMDGILWVKLHSNSVLTKQSLKKN